VLAWRASGAESAERFQGRARARGLLAVFEALDSLVVGGCDVGEAFHAGGEAVEILGGGLFQVAVRSQW
jgi:hypothetical protein